MAEDEGTSLEETPPVEVPPAEVPAADAGDPEPEGVVEVAGQRLAPVSAIIAERRRAKEAHEREMAPLRERLTRAEQIEQRLEQLRPELERMRDAPPPEQKRVDPVQAVSDDDAERLAKRYELYTPTGLDLPRAKQIIAEQRSETAKIAEEAAARAVAPLMEGTAASASKQNFVWAASQKGDDGQPLVDPHVLASLWTTFPKELTANPQVAEVILNAAVGGSVRTKKAPVARPGEPTFTESPGGRRPASYTISSLEKKVADGVGVSAADWEKSAKTYQPGTPNTLE